MKTSKLLYLLSGVIVATLLIYSCKDDFSEKDFLDMQAQQAASNHQYSMDEILYQAQLARSSDSALAVLQNMLSAELYMLQDSIKYQDALNQLRNAGLLLSWTIQVQENRTALDSVQVDIQTADLDNARTLSGVTDANGYVTFTDVTVGRNLVRLSKSGYMTANVAVEFTANQISTSYTGGTYVSVVVRRQESTILPVFSSSSSSTATIWGSVTADFDLTNNAPEAAVGTTVRANLESGLIGSGLIYPDGTENPSSIGENSGASGNSGSAGNPNQRVLVYTVEGEPNVGVATVDSTGHYKMIVPAVSDGMCVDMIWQSFKHSVKQAMRWNEATGMPLDSPMWVTVDRFFGPDAGNTAPVQFVPGAWAKFPAPTGGGSGFGLTFTVNPRDLGTWVQGDDILGPNDINGYPTPNEDGFDQDDVHYRLANAGAGFTASPDIAVAAPTSGTAATMVAQMDGEGFGVNITDGGAGYTASDNVTVAVYVRIGNDTFQIATFTYIAPGAGALPTGAIDFVGDGITVNDGTDITTSNANGFTNDAGGSNTAWYSRQHDGSVTGSHKVITFFTVVSGGTATTDATASVSRTLEIDDLMMEDGGSGYVAAPSSITFSGGGATTNPVVTVGKFATDYTVTVDNTNTSPYTILPDVEIFIQQYSNLQWVESNNVSFTVPNAESYSDAINNKLVIDSNGDIQFFDSYTFVTSNRSAGVPYATVSPVPTKQASALVWVNTDGQVENLVTGNTPGISNNGDGYTSAFSVTIVPTISGAPGSGAEVSLYGFTPVTVGLSSGEVQWNGSNKIVNPGSGYLQSLNFPYESFVNGYFGGLIYQLYRDDVDYLISLQDGEDSNLPDGYDCSIQVYPGDVYEVNGFYGSGALGQGKDVGSSVFPGFQED